MKIPRTQIAQVVTQKIGTVSTKKLSRDIAAYLLETNRVGELDSLLRDVTNQRAEAGTVEVVAISAHKLSDRVRTDIKSQVKKLYPHAKHILVTEELDSSIVGGVQIEFPNQQLDLSIRATLNRFKQLTAVGE